MYESKFITLLRTLDKQELRAFSQYLKNLYPGKNVQSKVFDFIKEFNPDYLSPKLNQEELNKKILKEKTIPAKKITDCLSDLNLLLLEFLLWKDSQKNEVQKTINTIRILKERKLNNAALKLIHKTRRTLAKNKTKNEWYFLHQMLLNYEESFIVKPINNEEEIYNLKSYMNHLDLFFIISKLKLISETKSRHNILGSSLELSFIAYVDKMVLSMENTSVILIKLYFEVIKLIDKKSPNNYLKLKNLVLENSAQLSKRDFKTLLIYLINYSALKIREGNLEYFKEAFELSDLGLKNKVLFENNYITPTRFINIIDVACKLEAFDWIENFMRLYDKHLEESNRHSTILISKARYHFAKGQFAGVIQKLSTTKFKNPFLELRAKSLLLRSYVELKENKDFILNFCKSYEQFIKRKTDIGASILSAYRNMVKMVKHIVLDKKSKSELTHLKKNMKLLTCREWIETQIKKGETKIDKI